MRVPIKINIPTEISNKLILFLPLIVFIIFALLPIAPSPPILTSPFIETEESDD